MSTPPPVHRRDFMEAETFDGLWPYKAHYAETPDDVRAHYVDTGDPESETTVVAVHGSPTWGFMYRHLADGLQGDARIVIPDLVGFGKSDAVGRASWYGLDRHRRALEAVLDAADVRNVVLVVHDWGGPIGLSWAVDNADRLAGLVLTNTWAFAPKKHVRLHPFLQVLRAPLLGALLVQNFDVVLNALNRGVVHRGRLTDAVMEAYSAPFPSPQYRAGMRAFPRLVADSPDHASWDFMDHLERNLPKLTCPVRIVWGERDPIYPSTVPDLFRRRLPHVENVQMVEDASHLVAEDAPAPLENAVRKLLA